MNLFIYIGVLQDGKVPQTISWRLTNYYTLLNQLVTFNNTDVVSFVSTLQCFFVTSFV